MTPSFRWIVFNVVGAVGMAVQLAALAVFNRWLHGHYLVASAAALEVALLHNFAWHRQYTWRDRREGCSLGRQLLRFQVANGLLSLAGNLALMRLLVHAAHLPVLLANAVAILCCSAANFGLSHGWAFSAQRPPSAETQPCVHTAVCGRALPLAEVAKTHADQSVKLSCRQHDAVFQGEGDRGKLLTGVRCCLGCQTTGHEVELGSLELQHNRSG